MKKSTSSFEPWLDVYIIQKTSYGARRIHTLSQPSKSFLKQWTQRIKAAWSTTAEPSTKATDGTLVSGAATPHNINGPAGNALYGIVLGTGTNAVAINDYKLQTQILNGSGAGQLIHAAVTFDALQVIGNVASFRARRQFENLSGNTITVKEAGIYAYYNGTYYFCTVRDLFTTPQDVLNAQIIEARYTFKATA